MLFLILFLSFFLGFYLYKKTRSYIWAVLGTMLGFIIIPFVFDQARLLWGEDKVIEAAGTTSTAGLNTSSAAYRTTAKSCSCNG